MRITIDPFDKESISKAIVQVKQYKKDFLAKEKLFVRRLAEIGVSVASTGFDLADYDGVNDVVVTWQKQGDKVVVIANGSSVGFIEFGTGVRFPEWDNSGMEYTPPQHGTYGEGHGKQPYGWYFKPGEGASQHTYGQHPAEAMRTARDVMVEKVVQVAREVWR